MADYCNYKYEFEPSSQKWIFRSTGQQLDAEAMRRRWSEDLTKVPILYLSKKVGGTFISVPCHIIGKQGDVFLLAVHNVKSLKQYKEMEDTPTCLESYPHCKVIVDNRRGVQQILVEKNEAFNGKPAMPIKMIKEYIDHLYQGLECTVRMSSKILAGDVWKAVKVFQANGQRVRSVSFRIGQQDQVDCPDEEMAELLRSLSQYRQIVGAAMAEFRALSDSTTHIAFSDLNDDCKRLVEVIGNNGYDLEVRFTNRGVYKSKKYAVATFRLPDNIDNDFIAGHKMLDGELALVKWLDKIRTNNDEYTDVLVKAR